MKKTIIYNSIILFLYICLYIWYLFIVKQDGMKDLGFLVTIIYIVLPFLSIIGGIIQRLFIKNIMFFILTNYILNCLFLYLITRSVMNVLIICLIYVGLTIVLSYTTRSVLLLWKRKK